jgi:hypothetical protein
VVGWQTPTKPDWWQPAARAWQANGQQLWKATLPWASNSGATMAVLALADGGAAVAGFDKTHLKVARITPGGEIAWQATGIEPAVPAWTGGQWVGLALTGDGALAVVTSSSSAQVSAGKDDVHVARLSLAGVWGWQALVTSPGANVPRAVTGHADGSTRVLTFTIENSGFQTATRLFHVSATGQGQWVSDVKPVVYPHDLAARADGQFAITSRPPNVNPSPIVVRMDAWGAASCADAGPCADKGATDCNDGKACTADQCSGKLSGCVFPPVSDGVACDPPVVCASEAIACDGGQLATSKPEGSGWTKASCDDGDPCTDDVCDAAQFQCSHAPKNCNDANDCTADACDKGACTHKALDGQVCTGGSGCNFDACKGDVCTKGAGPGCDDKDPCTDDACGLLDMGCHYMPATGKSCGSNLTCTQGNCSKSCTTTAQCLTGCGCGLGACAGKPKLVQTIDKPLAMWGGGWHGGKGELWVWPTHVATLAKRYDANLNELGTYDRGAQQVKLIAADTATEWYVARQDGSWPTVERRTADQPSKLVWNIGSKVLYPADVFGLWLADGSV